MLIETLDEYGKSVAKIDTHASKVSLSLPSQQVVVRLNPDEFSALQREMNTAIHNQLVTYANTLKQRIGDYANGFSLIQSLMDSGKKSKMGTPSEWASIPYLQSHRKKLRLFMESVASHMLIDATIYDPLNYSPGRTFNHLRSIIEPFAGKKTAPVELEPSSLNFDSLLSDPDFNTGGKHGHEEGSIFRIREDEPFPSSTPAWFKSFAENDSEAFIVVTHVQTGILLRIPVIMANQWISMAPLRDAISALEHRLSQIHCAIDQLTEFTLGTRTDELKKCPELQDAWCFLWEIQRFSHPAYQNLLTDDFNSKILERFTRYLPEFLRSMSSADFSRWSSVSAPAPHSPTIQ